MFYYVLVTVLGTGDTAMKGTRIYVFMGIDTLEARRTKNNYVHIEGESMINVIKKKIRKRI